MTARPPVPQWTPWAELALILRCSEKTVRRRAREFKARVFYSGKQGRGVLTADVPLLYGVRRAS